MWPCLWEFGKLPGYFNIQQSSELLTRPVCLKLDRAAEFPRGLVTAQVADPSPEFLCQCLVAVGWNLGICISTSSQGSHTEGHRWQHRLFSGHFPPARGLEGVGAGFWRRENGQKVLSAPSPDLGTVGLAPQTLPEQAAWPAAVSLSSQQPAEALSMLGGLGSASPCHQPPVNRRHQSPSFHYLH